MKDWISVNDRLPDNAQPVLIAECDLGYSSSAISGEYFTEAGFIYVDPRGGMRRGRDVRYWMPSPPIPESQAMDRNDAIDLLRAADVEEERIDEDAILIASVVGTMAVRIFVEVAAKRIITDTGLDAEIHRRRLRK